MYLINIGSWYYDHSPLAAAAAAAAADERASVSWFSSSLIRF